MNALYAFFAVILLTLFAFIGVWSLGLYSLFGIIIPYTALVTFFTGFIYRVLKWASSPVPFPIPIVRGQQKSLPWIKANNLDSPYNSAGVFIRMLLDVLLFRPLFWNERAKLRKGQKIVYGGNKLLWLGGLAFHWSLFIILFRHLRLFIEPVPSVVLFFRNMDGILQSLLPVLFISDFVIVISLTYLFLRRIVYPQMRYLSLFADYFAILLIFGVVVSGIFMRVFFRVDIAGVKKLAMSLITFHPTIPDGIGWHFYLHLFFISALLAYIPFSKLMHAAGIFLSPTINLKNDSRMRRYVNPWDYPVKEHTYEEWEDEFREVIKKARLPLEKE